MLVLILNKGNELIFAILKYNDNDNDNDIY
jgi:hypothetical protein